MVWLLLSVPALIGILYFTIIMHKEPRSLWSGFSFLCMLAGIGLSSILILFLLADDIVKFQWLHQLLIILLFAVVLILMMFPLLLAGTFMIEGIRLIRREGFSLTNCLSLGFGIGILLMIVVAPFIISHVTNGIVLFLYGLGVNIILYFSAVLAMFTFSALVNLIHPLGTKKLDQIVVLGSGIFGDKVTPLLAGRIEKGIELQKKNPGALLILSGGQGPGEDIPEGQAMKTYALEHGANPQRTISEEKSRNTWENLAFSSQLFEKPDGRTALVSTRYHVYRALIQAKMQNIACIGVGSATKFYFTLNAFLREFVGYLSLSRKVQLKVLGILLFPYVFFGLLNLIVLG